MNLYQSDSTSDLHVRGHAGKVWCIIHDVCITETSHV